MRKVIVVAVLAWSTFGALPLAEAAPEDLANDIAGEVMSPFCEGVTLHDCPSAAAEALRRRIVRWAEAGWSRDRIMSELVDQYGPGVRSSPPAEGSGLLAWILPGLALAGGGALAWMLVRRWTTRPPTPAEQPLDPDDRRRIEIELRQLKGES